MSRNRRSGFTVLELLISMGVFTVLIAVLAPAVQLIHESSRSTQCRNNFRQVNLALQQYVTTFGQFPRTGAIPGSSFVVLLPYLEKQALYDAIIGEATQKLDRSAYSSPVVFKCPNDVVACSYAQGCSFGENTGTCISETRPHNEDGRKYDGVFLTHFENISVTPASISDGLSHTAAYGEILAFPRPGHARMIYTRRVDMKGCFSVQDQATRCRMSDHPMTTTPMARGTTWRFASMEMNSYIHALPPNTKECRFVPNSASTHHSSAYSALCDGSVRLISSSIDEAVWQALGSRNGHEAVSDF